MRDQEKIERISCWAQGKTAPPIKIDLEPTYGCNLKCVFCWTQDPKRIGYAAYRRPLTENRIYKVIDEAAEIGVREWQVAGGWEPMIKPKLGIEIIERIKGYGMYGCLTTNGTLLSDEIIERLVKVGWDQILFSIEGATAKTHDFLVGREGAFEKAVKAMKSLKYWMEKYNSRVPNYSFHSVLTSVNFRELPQMVKLAYEVGAIGVNIEPVTIWNDGLLKYRLNEEQKAEFQKILPKAIEIAEELHIAHNFHKMLEDDLIDKSKMLDTLSREGEQGNGNPFLSVACYEPWLNMEIRASGHIVPCRLNDDDDYIHIDDYSLEEVWNSKFFNDIRLQILTNNLPRYCSTCFSGQVVKNRIIREGLKTLLNVIAISNEPAIQLSSLENKADEQLEKLKRRIKNQDEQILWLEDEILKRQMEIMKLEQDWKDFERIKKSPLFKWYSKIFSFKLKSDTGGQEGQ